MTGNLHTLVRDLQRRKARERRGMIVAEGRRLVADALDSGAPVAGILVSDDAGQAVASSIVEPAQGRGIRVETIPRQEFDELADTATPSGVLAIVEWEPLALAELPAPAAGTGPLLVLDGVQDPGNVGSMIRTALALGAWATVALDGTADVRSPKASRGSMGALFRHPVGAATFEQFVAWGRERSLFYLVAAMDGQSVRHGKRSGEPPVALVVGSEGHGARPGWYTVGARRVAIPMKPGAESLNAAVAAGILLYELTRA
jgi:TrmH family RNA methyltransferase